MRKIYFRAKSIDANNKGEWKFGFYRHFVCNGYDKHYIDSVGQNITTTIDVDTLGQYTNFLDKNENEIFEGDIFTIGDENIKYRVVCVENFGFMGQQMNSINGKDTGCRIGLVYWRSLIEIVGNIHEKKDE